MKKILSIGLMTTMLFTSCGDMFNPAIENNLELENTFNSPIYAQGLLLNGYTRVPTNSWSFNDVATDDAVTNDMESDFLKIATGQWTAINNPLDQWRNSKSAIQYLNTFLSISDRVDWAEDPTISTMFNDRMKGEAYGLRALFMFYLLQSHAGKSVSGELLGVPILLESESGDSDFNHSRATFEEGINQIYSDIEQAEELLPLDYEDIASDSQIPSKYTGINRDDYNRVFGSYFRLRMTERIAKGIRAKASLLAASPAYNTGNTTKWEDAAHSAAEVINLKGGISGIDPSGHTWYDMNAGIDNLGSGINPSEILWRNDKGNSNDLESAHFPPTLYGQGRVNPTQNLVDAFPMANGYPISDVTSGYDENSPYDNRDPRLKHYILVNGSTAGTSNTVINTAENSPTNDGLNKVGTSTRTGYYLRKLLRQDVNLNPSSTTQQQHYNVRIRYTEIYLAYAEAANEAWGPTGTGGHAYSAYDVIKAIRQRAGVGTNNNDTYLEQIKNDKDQMRTLIRNERRLELCFEGFRFWDLRRWNENINETAKGISIQNNSFSIINVENRLYDSYMIYGPIPYSETLKYSNLAQNAGW